MEAVTVTDIAVLVGATGTVILAVATYWLARSTRTLADETADELRAQWRPVLLAVQSPEDRTRSVENEVPNLVLRIRNAGRGPALYVRAQLDPLGLSPADWNRAAMAEGDEAALVFTQLSALPPAMQLLLDYRDLGGRQYATSAVITVNTDQNGQRTLNFYDVRTFRDKTLTTHGDSLPQPGLRPLPMDKQG
jgi:hypothetical protein